jgi:uncharacterized ion transporter superfamily protein YfcC
MKQNKNLKIIGAATILFVVIVIAVLFLVTYNLGSGMYIGASIIPGQPDKYVEMTPQELEKYPYVKEAVSNPGTNIKVSSDNIDSVEQFKNITIRSNNTYNIKVNGTYYEIDVAAVD